MTARAHSTADATPIRNWIDSIEAIRVEPDLRHRRQLVADALRIMHADLPLIPLYRRTLTWAMRPDIHVAQWPNDVLELRFVQIGQPPQ